MLLENSNTKEKLWATSKDHIHMVKNTLNTYAPPIDLKSKKFEKVLESQTSASDREFW